ncbi:MAG: hypothetical protein U0350_40005 [Caldilineaceae bacterium]
MKSVQMIDETGATWLLSGGNPVNFVYLHGAQELAPVRRLTQRAPLQNGVLDKGFRLDPRQMQLDLLMSTDEVQSDGRWDRLVNLFAPTVNPLKLRVTRNDGVQRQIDCFVNGKVAFQNFTDTGNKQLLQVPLLAPDPTFYDPVQQVVTQSLSSGTTTINVPVTGLSADDWPVIEVTGPATVVSGTGLVIQHMAVNEAIQFGSLIGATETIRLDFRPGYKGVTQVATGANRLSYLKAAYLTQLATMRVLSEKNLKVAAPGNTSDQFVFTINGATGASSVTFKYYKRYLSL